MTVAEAVTLIAALTSAIVAVGGVAISWKSASKLDTVHNLVNSQATKFEALATQAGFARGVSSTQQPAAPDQPAGPDQPA